MSNNKQSSVVDFIYNELFVVKRWMDLTPGDIEYIFEQAKAKHYEECKESYYESLLSNFQTFEHYYEQTFGGPNA